MKSKSPGTRRKISAATAGYLARCIESPHPYYHPLHKCYKLGQKSLRGLATVLKDRFFPEYVIPRVGGGGKNGGQKRATKVDKELSAWAQSQGKSWPKRMHGYTRKVIDTTTREWKWRPWTGQFVVHDSRYNTGTATALDLAFISPRRELVPVELKTGFHGYWHHSQGFFREPLGDIQNCPHNQASLQLAMTCFLGEISGRFPRGKSLELSRVVRVEEDGVFAYELPQWANRKMCEDVLRSL